jgi:hypothetical protein
MKLSFSRQSMKNGLILYIAGLAIYFFSWIMQIHFTESTWSKSCSGFLAPAYTTIILLAGIGLMGNSLFIRIPYNNNVYFIICLLFVFVHTFHAYIVYSR